MKAGVMVNYFKPGLILRGLDDSEREHFSRYDIRGVFDRDFDPAFAYLLGRAYASVVLEDCVKNGAAAGRKRPCVGVGGDCRVSSPVLRSELARGLCDGGVDVLVTGMGPTPQLYFSVYSRDLDGGIQVTGSHNPGDQNGFKMMVGKRTLSGADIQDLKSRVLRLASSLPPDAPRGNVSEVDARTEYIAELVRRSKDHVSKTKQMRIVVDGGNGVGGMVGPEVLRQLGCEVIELYTTPDGTFPNHHPDPTVLENIAELRRVVVEKKADAGIAWDGDADRIGIVDELGQPIYGDMLLLIYGRQLLQELKQPVIIGDVKCSELLFSDLQKRGAKAVMAKTGHSLIKAKLNELRGDLAGEMSGHMFFKHRFYGFDDALHASARFVEILSHSAVPVSAMLADLPKVVCTPELRVDCPEQLKFIVAEKAKEQFPEFETNTIDGVRIKFPHGWGLVRASNTQAILVMRFEAETPEQLHEYQTLVEGRIRKLQASL